MNNEAQQPQSAAGGQSVETTPDLTKMSLGEYREHREKASATPAKNNDEAAAAKEGKPAASEESGANEVDAESEVDEHALGSEGTPANGQQPPKRKGGFQKKIERLEHENAELQRKLAGNTAAPSEAKPTAAATPAATPKPFDKPKPKLADCADIEDFTEKLADWKAEERDWKREQKAEADRNQAAEASRASEAQTLAGNWKSRENDFKASHPDYDEVLGKVKDVKISQPLQRIFLESDMGPELAYELAQNPDELKKFAALSPSKAAVYIGRLEAKLTPQAGSSAGDGSTKAATEEKVSNAPAPIRPPSGGKTVETKPDPAKLSLPQYRELRENGKIK